MIDKTPEGLKQLGEDIKALLHDGIVAVNFTKKDGTVRLLRGTLKADLLPKPEPVADGAEVKPARKQSDDVVSCFDVDKQEWRSFRKDSVISYEPESK